MGVNKNFPRVVILELGGEEVIEVGLRTGLEGGVRRTFYPEETGQLVLGPSSLQLKCGVHAK